MPDIQDLQRRFLRYLSDLVQLRLAVEKNISDVESSQQIVYVADANVIHLFLSPFSNWNKVSPFREILPEKKELGVATAVITAEYIFSRRLPRQKKYPVFVATEHVEEVVEHFHRLQEEQALYSIGQTTRHEPSAAPTDETDWDRVEESLERLRQQLSDKSYDPTKTHQLLGSTITRAVNLLNRKGYLAREQFARLQREDLIRPLRLAPHIDRQRLENHRGAEFSQWRSDLETFDLRSHSRDQGQTPPLPREKILSRDASVLATLYALNEDLIERKAPVKVVLITEDEKIHYSVAYQKRYERYGGENFLRRPIQFLPALNFEDMPNLVGKSDSAIEFRSVIDSILGNRANITAEFLYQLTHELAVELKKNLQGKQYPGLSPWQTALQAWYHTIQTSFDFSNAPRIEEGIPRVRRAWDELSNNAVSLNVELLSHRFHRELDPLAATLRQLKQTNNVDRLAAAFEAYQEERLDILERQHIEWSLEWLIADPVGSGSDIPRGPLLIRQDRLGVAGEADLAPAIENVTKCVQGRRGSAAVTQALKQHDFPDLVIIAAVAAYRMGGWSQARDFGDRALHRLRRMLSSSENSVSTSIRELEYFVALCQRFEFTDIDVKQYQSERERSALRARLDAAERAHDNALRLSEGVDFFTAARANAELGTLYVAKISIGCIHPDLNLLREHERFRLASRAIDHLRHARDDLEGRFPNEIVAHRQSPISDLCFQVNVNLIGAFAFFGLENLYRVSPTLMSAALDYVRPRLQNFPPHLAVDVAICEWMLEKDASERSRRARFIHDECTRFLEGYKGTLTRFDREGLEHYRRRLPAAGAREKLPA